MASILERPDEEDDHNELMNSAHSKQFNEDHVKLKSDSFAMKLMQMVSGDGAAGPEISFYGHIERLVEVLQRPAVFITLILITILMLLSLEYGSMQRQMNLMEDHMHKMHYREKDLLKELSRLRGDVRRVTRDEKSLKMQESNLDKQFKKMQDEVKKIEKNSWGEKKAEGDSITIHQEPLMPHLTPMGPFGRPLPPFLQGLGGMFSHIMDDIKQKNSLVNRPPQPSPFGLPRLSLFNDFHDLPEIEIIELEDEPTDSKENKKEEHIKVQKIG